MPKDKKNRKPRRKAHSTDDDSSVDSKGNLRNLIDYDYHEDDAEYTTSEEEMAFETDTKESSDAKPPPRRQPQRKAAIKARERIRMASVSSSEVEEPKQKRKTKTKTKDESSSDESEISERLERAIRKNASRRRLVRRVVESEDESDDDDDSESTSEAEPSPFMGFRIGGLQPNPNQPRKHKMKDQPEIVQRFVKLVQKGNDNDEQASHIDNDITYFKKLPVNQQTQIIEKMERKFSMDDETPPLKFRILEKQVPAYVEKVAMSKYNMLMTMEPSSGEYFKCHHWVEGYSQLPLGVYRDLPVQLEDGPEKCAGFVSRVRECMDSAIYGHDDAKLQVLQFVSTWIANPKGAGNVLSVYGPMGVGKTTLVKEGVAKALERPFHFISLGGATDASYLDGHSYTYEGSTWGRIVDILMQSKCMNPIIYFDELDKVSDTPKGEEIMNLLIHITDGSQNDKFQDKYFSGIDIDLSRCLFIFSHNNHERVNPILRDRMYNIKVNGFNMKEKLVIAEQYIINNALRNVGLHEKVSIARDVIEYIIENHTGEEKGVRELKRCFETIMSKLNLLRFYNDPKMVPFAIKDFSLPFILKQEHIKLFLKKNEEESNESFAHLYI